MARFCRRSGQTPQAGILRDWQTKLDQFLQFNDRDVLEGAGKISKKTADEKACSEYLEFEKAAPAERSRR